MSWNIFRALGVSRNNSIHEEALLRLVKGSGSRSLLEYGYGSIVGKQPLLESRLFENMRVARYDPLEHAAAPHGGKEFDGVVCADWLDHVEANLPGIIEDLFRSARMFVYASVAYDDLGVNGGSERNRRRTHKGFEWWETQFRVVAARYPDRYWELAGIQRSWRQGLRVRWAHGGRFGGVGKPTVWVLTDDRPGNNSQSIGLAEALGWPYEMKPIQFYRFARFLARLPNGLLGISRVGIRAGRHSPLLPPWPDLVIATGRRLAPLARWIRRQSRGYSCIVHLGRRGAYNPEDFDLLVSCAHFGLMPHVRRIEVVAPVNPIGPGRLAQAATRWPNLFGQAPRPHIVLLVGGTSSFCSFDEETARRLGREVRAFAASAGGTVHAVTSRRTGEHQASALEEELGKSNSMRRWQPTGKENPYLGYLATADVLVVTGDSESMLAEAVASGKPVYIYPLPECFPGTLGKVRERFREWVGARGTAGRSGYDASGSGGQGWQRRLCAFLLSRSLVLPPRNIKRLHQGLYRLGVARPFGTELVMRPCPALYESERVARQVRVILRMQDENPVEAETKELESVMTKA